jgi:hypothetical protein
MDPFWTFYLSSPRRLLRSINKFIKSQTAAMFCTYLTLYSGNKLPPFYIGSTSVKRVEDEGYGGSVSSKLYAAIWRSERKAHPELFRTQILSIHTSRKDAFDKEQKLQLAVGAAKSPMYMNRTTANKFCDTTGMKFSLESRAKMSAKAKAAVKAGKHPLQNSKRHKDRSKVQFEQGTHNFQVCGSASAHAAMVNRQTYAAGKHPSQKIRICPHCSHEGRGPQMFRRHFDKCQSNHEKIPA